VLRMRRLISSLVVAGTVLGTIAALPAASAQAAAVPSGFTDAEVASFSSPTAVEWLPNDQVVVLEKGGRIKVGPPAGPFVTAHTISNICTDSERGLLGLTPDPGFSGNGFVYVYYTRTAAGAPGGCVNRVSRFTLLGQQVVAGSEVVLIDNISSNAGNHNGGDVDIASDGFLYVAVGDAGRDPRNDSGSGGGNDAGQDLSLLNGKILRLTLTGQPAPGNPISGPNTVACGSRGNTSSTPSTWCQEIFAYGLRNPYRFAFDRDDGSSTFYINDVGQGTYEEVDRGQIGANYGWPIREGGCPQGDTVPCDAPAPGSGLVDPIAFYGRSDGTYVTAGAFVPDGLWPAEYDGSYLFADGGSGDIWHYTAAGTVDYATPFATDAQGITDMTFGFDTDGMMVLYYVQVGGGLRKVTPNATPVAPASGAMKFESVTPARVYDTDGTGVAAGKAVGATTRLVDLAAPAGARAALVNITIADTAGPGFLRTWIAGGARPETSTVNADQAGAFVANAATIPIDGAGRFIVEAATTARVVIDVVGWFTPSGATSGGRFVAVDPDRVTDTRQPAGAGNSYTRSGSTITVFPWGPGGAPTGEPASAVVLSIGAIAGPGVGGFVGAYPAGGTYAGTSNVNFLNGDVRANTVVVPLGTDNGVNLETLNVGDVVVEVVGYFTASAAGSASTGLFSFVTPDRIVDTRTNLGFSRLGTRTPATIDTGVSGSAVLQNVTVTNTSAAGWLATYPAGATTPEISTVNFVGPNQTRAVLAFTKLTAGDASYESLVPTDVVVDVVGTFS
jgi:glucose/arabinose dehydrogenase